jgi:DNA polymerase-1
VNFQNIPRDLKVVKAAFVPKQGALSYFDYSQVEPRLAAYFSHEIGHPEFAQLLRSGVDAYTAIARLVTGKDEVTKEERKDWKVMFLSLMYGGGIRTIQEQFGVNQQEARRMIRTFHSNFPAVRALQDMVEAVHARRGFIKTPWGRHLHAEQFGEHKLLNKLIQGSAADLMKEALIKVDSFLQLERGLPISSHMVNVVHDEIQLDGPEDEVAFLHEHIPVLMRPSDEIHNVVPILVDHEVSTTTWADKIPYDEWKEARAASHA